MALLVLYAPVDNYISSGHSLKALRYLERRKERDREREREFGTVFHFDLPPARRKSLAPRERVVQVFLYNRSLLRDLFPC